ncbi:MAG: bifunctional adenosylcobinamide kinase/adenosylcobinamide-phosphate guanylyltransferase [Methylococcales bacterium]|nr:bifunctional adenosylcobinamide kinase/adenosylcobinamide-phosphate guanylyltransferase [Methylococcales bacterium]MCK5925257.1 bifunctional adenosylcobinamide kinase/adenosylcobinamide-phosphate guanylyltransferase [Methylococcales bacterium]
MVQLILGGARSGKSYYAEQLAVDSGKKCFYIATAYAGDDEMRHRIILHQQRRPKHWTTLEESLYLAKILQKTAQEEVCIVVDCLTLWLSNILFNQQGELQETLFKQQTTALLDLIKALEGEVIFVSNEVGGGIIPMNAMSRRFVDEAGLLHQQLAQRCDQVVLVTAGLPQVLK